MKVSEYILRINTLTISGEIVAAATLWYKGLDTLPVDDARRLHKDTYNMMKESGVWQAKEVQELPRFKAVAGLFEAAGLSQGLEE